MLLLLAYAIMFLPRAVVTRPRPRWSRRRRCSTTSRTRSGVGPLVDRSPGHPAADRSRASAPAPRWSSLPSTTELTATLLLAPIGTDDARDRSSGRSSSAVAYGAAAPYAVLMVLISLPATYLLSRRREGPVPS